MVNLSLQRKLAAQVLKCAPEKVKFDSENLTEIKEGITKADIKSMVGKGLISVKHSPGSSRVRARKILIQKRKGLQKGHGSRKGRSTARAVPKEEWMNKIRKQRALLRKLKEREMLTSLTYRNLMLKAKGGFFRSERHLKTFIAEQNLVKSKQN
jgi:large subunit ribosomal protein L19e